MYANLRTVICKKVQKIRAIITIPLTPYYIIDIQHCTHLRSKATGISHAIILSAFFNTDSIEAHRVCGRSHDASCRPDPI